MFLKTDNKLSRLGLATTLIMLVLALNSYVPPPTNVRNIMQLERHSTPQGKNFVTIQAMPPCRRADCTRQSPDAMQVTLILLRPHPTYSGLAS